MAPAGVHANRRSAVTTVPPVYMDRLSLMMSAVVHIIFIHCTPLVPF
jgi:hypothetical protein